MRCSKCKYNVRDYNSMQGDMDEYCQIFGYDCEKNCVENSNGEMGCRFREKTLDKLYAIECKKREKENI